jgi:hypothetical protein
VRECERGRFLEVPVNLFRRAIVELIDKRIMRKNRYRNG